MCHYIKFYEFDSKIGKCFEPFLESKEFRFKIKFKLIFSAWKFKFLFLVTFHRQQFAFRTDNDIVDS